MENAMNKHRIAVVGGGSVGVAYVTQLIEQAVQEGLAGRLEILIFEPQQLAGPGYAYQADCECNLLNTRADAMSAVAGNKRHFVDWLMHAGARHAGDFPETVVNDNAFLPRGLFGRYLAEHYRDALAAAQAHGIDVIRIAGTVTDLMALADHRPCLDTDIGAAYVVDRVVLCLGNLPPTNFAELNDKRGVYRTPYPTRATVRDIPKVAPVCVLGTGLSAIDAVISLVDAGHTGKIIMASRHGRLPSVRGAANRPHKLTRMTREQIDALCASNGGTLKLSDVFKVLCQEIEEATGTQVDLSLIMNSHAGILDYITTEIALASSTERLWQSVIYSTNSVIDYVWHRLSREDKREFQDNFGSLWSAYRVSFPVKNAQKLHTLLRADRVMVFGGVSDVRYNDDEQLFETRIDDRARGFRSVIQSEYLINATGYSVQVTRSDVPLVRNLLRRKLARPDEFGGFELDFDTGKLIGADGAVWSNVSVLGSLASGTYFWTNAMDVNVRLARQQVDDTLQVIMAGVPTIADGFKRAVAKTASAWPHMLAPTHISHQPRI